MVHYLGKEAAFFAYPYGSETPRVQRYLDNRNVTTFSLNIGLINEQTDITHSLPRTMIDKRTWHNVVVPWVK
ncbi:polysaccharide deacetylase family protein [Lactiplantibacillus plantarum]|nr:polysaccharide deacetylase family protein [Lactiplantibacillus plantarum]